MSRYIYTNKKKFEKGANRFCTQFYHSIKALKESDHEAARSRRLVLIGDNYSENKNNDDFAFASELVARGWYDVVELYYGPVGHTHNGVDADHKIHNQHACNFTLGTLADLVNVYQEAWSEPTTRPEYAICELQLNWKKRYAKVVNRLSGFQVSGANRIAVHGFKFERHGGSGPIMLMWKRAPSRLSPWLGANHEARSRGFRILKRIPQGAPEVILPKPLWPTKRIATSSWT